MPGAGVEPARPFGPGGLSALRLPFRHPGGGRAADGHTRFGRSVLPSDAIGPSADDPTFEPCPALVTKDADGSDPGGGQVVRVPEAFEAAEAAELNPEKRSRLTRARAGSGT